MTVVIGILSCVKQEDVKTIIDTPIDTRVKDIDGNFYDTIKVGTQVWMKENLRTSHYNDGSVIPTGNSSWQSTTTGAFAVYNNVDSNNTIYGKLYNWYAVNTGKLAPKGWHVPTESEWTTLINYLGGQYVACSVMLSGNNNSFTTKLGGQHYSDNKFYYIETYGFFWTSTESTFPNGRYFTLCNCGTNVVSCYGSKMYGFSVRCIRDY